MKLFRACGGEIRMGNRYFLFGIVGARIHAVAMLSLAETQLSASARVIDVIRSAKVL